MRKLTRSMIHFHQTARNRTFVTLRRILNHIIGNRVNKKKREKRIENHINAMISKCKIRNSARKSLKPIWPRLRTDRRSAKEKRNKLPI